MDSFWQQLLNKVLAICDGIRAWAVRKAAPPHPLWVVGGGGGKTQAAAPGCRHFFPWIGMPYIDFGDCLTQDATVLAYIR